MSSGSLNNVFSLPESASSAAPIVGIAKRLNYFQDREASLSHYLEDEELLDSEIQSSNGKDSNIKEIKHKNDSFPVENRMEQEMRSGAGSTFLPSKADHLSSEGSKAFKTSSKVLIDNVFSNSSFEKFNNHSNSSLQSSNRFTENISNTSQQIQPDNILPSNSMNSNFKLTAVEPYSSEYESLSFTSARRSSSPSLSSLPISPRFLKPHSSLSSTAHHSSSHKCISAPSSPVHGSSAIVSDALSFSRKMESKSVPRLTSIQDAFNSNNDFNSSISTPSKKSNSNFDPILDSCKTFPGYSTKALKRLPDLYSIDDMFHESSATSSSSSSSSSTRIQTNQKSQTNHKSQTKSNSNSNDHRWSVSKDLIDFMSIPKIPFNRISEPKSFRKPNSLANSPTDKSSFNTAFGDLYATEPSSSEPVFVPAPEPVSNSISVRRSVQRSKINVTTCAKHVPNQTTAAGLGPNLGTSSGNTPKASKFSQIPPALFSMSDSEPKFQTDSVPNPRRISVKNTETSIPDSKPNFKLQHDSESEPEPELEQKHKPEPEPEPEMENNTQAKPEPRPEPEPEVRSPVSEPTNASNDDLKNDSNNAAQTESHNVPDCYLIVHNVAKRHNLGTLVRSASAFNVKEMILVGRRDFNSFGSHGSVDFVSFRHFFNLKEAKTYLKSIDCDICGVEIMENAFSVNSHPFKKSTAFLLGNEGTGLSEKEISFCDFFVYIPQYGSGTASLNVSIAASIILHNFAAWAGYKERVRLEQKFLVGERPMRKNSRNICPPSPTELALLRKQKAEMAKSDWIDFDNDRQNDDANWGHEISSSCDNNTNGGLDFLFAD